jgi:hypothetical protein
MAQTVDQLVEWARAVLPALKERIDATQQAVEKTRRRLTQ